MDGEFYGLRKTFWTPIMRKSSIYLFTILLLFSLPLLAQSNGSVRGTIIDSENGEPVFGATIVVRSINKFAKTDFDGKYNLPLPAGSYDVEFQMYGYGPQVRKVNISGGQVESINVTFGAQTLQTVEVTDRALNNTEASLLALQKKSGTVSDGISAEAIKKSPDSSASEVIKRVTGITLIGGKYVFVRGLGERYSNTMLNDQLIPSTEPDKKVIPLDIFPSNLLKNIRVIKTFAPEDSAEFSGGIVKIETKEYPDQFTMSAGLGVGMNHQTTNYRFLQREGGDFLGRPTSSEKLPSLVSGLPEQLPFEPGNRFGGLPPAIVGLGQASFPQTWSPDDKKAPYDKNFNFTVGNTLQTTESGQRLGILFGVTQSTNYRYKQESARRYFPSNPINTQFKDFTTLNEIQSQDTKVFTQERLFGSNLNLAYEFKKGQQIYWKNLYTVSADNVVREGRGIDPVFNNAEFLALTSTFTSRQLFNSTFGGDHALNPFGVQRAHILSWSLNQAEAIREEPNLQQQAFVRNNPAPSVATPFRRLGNNPDGTRFYSDALDLVRSVNLKYEIPFEQWNGLKSTMKVGYMASDRKKTFRFREFGTKSNVGLRNPIDLYPVPGEIAYLPTDFISGNSSTGNANLTFAERQVEPNAYDAQQKLHGYFTQFDMPLFSKFRFFGGGRYEDSYQKVQTFVLRESSNPFARPNNGCNVNSEDERIALVRGNICNANNWGIGELKTRDYLPSANFVYELTKEQNLRLGYSQTLTRPDLRELSPFGFAPYYGADRIFGNPDLRRTYIHNYDFRWEWYANATDYIGVGAFFKQMSSPIELIGRPVAGQIGSQLTYTNAEQAVIRGVELDFRKEFFNLFRAESNFFFIKSKVDVLPWETYIAAKSGLLDNLNRAVVYDPTNLSRPLQGQSEFVANFKIDVFLTKSKNSTIGVFYNYFGDRIYAVGAIGTPDAYERGVGVTDVVFTHKHEEKVDFKLGARNVFNTRFRIYQRDELLNQEKLYLSYREGVSWFMSATYKFY